MVLTMWQRTVNFATTSWQKTISFISANEKPLTVSIAFFGVVGLFATLGVMAYQTWLMIENARLEQRPWVGVSRITRQTEPIVGKPFVIQVRFGNTGQTPALEVRMHSQLLFFYPTDETIDPGTGTKQEAYNSVAPGAYFVGHIREDSLDDTKVNALKAGKIVYASGVILYKDIWHFEHVTSYCALYRLHSVTGDALEFCPTFNNMK